MCKSYPGVQKMQKHCAVWGLQYGLTCQSAFRNMPDYRTLIAPKMGGVSMTRAEERVAPESPKCCINVCRSSSRVLVLALVGLQRLLPPVQLLIPGLLHRHRSGVQWECHEIHLKRSSSSSSTAAAKVMSPCAGISVLFNSTDSGALAQSGMQILQGPCERK